MTETTQPVRLAGSVVNRACHICAFFHSKEEQYRVLMPFFKDGIERGDRCFHILDPKYHDEHVRRLEQEGINVTDAQAKGVLDIRTWNEAHVQENPFYVPPDEMLKELKERASQKAVA